MNLQFQKSTDKAFKNFAKKFQSRANIIIPGKTEKQTDLKENFSKEKKFKMHLVHENSHN